MTQIKTFVFNPFQENTYVLYDNTNECVIIDAGCHSETEQEELVNFIKSNNLKPKLAINTHGHVDHVLGNSFIKSQFNIDIAGHAEDMPMLQSAATHALMYGLTIDDVPLFDKYINEGDTLRFGESEIEVVYTPGHSRGGVCLLLKKENFMISGDTLFKASIGRTDLPGGNYDTLIESIKNKILTLQEDIIVYPGHGEPTTTGWEKENNPFLA